MDWSKFEQKARRLDEQDELASFRDDFIFPDPKNDKPCTYLCGNSLGLMPKAAKDALNKELEAWQSLAIGGHFREENPWKNYQQTVRPTLARLVGAKEEEVVAMNALTINLHLLMVSFFKPSHRRYKILIEESAFPSDRYAIESQLVFHGLDPKKSLIEIKLIEGDLVFGDEPFLEAIDKAGESLALVLLPGVQYLSGERFNIKAITKAAHKVGAKVGFDLAHAIGNVPLTLHEDKVDFAIWCHYKYLNAGPGAVGGAFIHQRHLSNPSIARFNGWWGNDVSSRFAMAKEFQPFQSAEAWLVSNSPVLLLAALRGSCEIFDKVSMHSLRQKGDAMTLFAEELLSESLSDKVQIKSPSDPLRRGNQLSIVLDGDGKKVVAALKEKNVIVDYREPNVIRFAFAPLYNRFQDITNFVRVLYGELTG